MPAAASLAEALRRLLGVETIDIGALLGAAVMQDEVKSLSDFITCGRNSVEAARVQPVHRIDHQRDVGSRSCPSV